MTKQTVSSLESLKPLKVWSHYLANPNRFLRVGDMIFPYLWVLCCLCFGMGLTKALMASPPDYQQGEAVRIMYVHVPAAWLSMMVYGFMGVAAVFSYIYKNPFADILMRAAAPIGMVFTLITLVTGMLWGKPIWGAAWVWDARLTSVLVLFFIYVGYLFLMKAIPSQGSAAKVGRLLILVGLVNLPIIKFSVDWWNTLHQPASIMRLDTPAIDGSMLSPLLWMAGAYLLTFLILLHLRVRAEVAARKARLLEIQMMRGTP